MLVSNFSKETYVIISCLNCNQCRPWKPMFLYIFSKETYFVVKFLHMFLSIFAKETNVVL